MPSRHKCQRGSHAPVVVAVSQNSEAGLLRQPNCCRVVPRKMIGRQQIANGVNLQPTLSLAFELRCDRSTDERFDGGMGLLDPDTSTTVKDARLLDTATNINKKLRMVNAGTGTLCSCMLSRTPPTR